MKKTLIAALVIACLSAALSAGMGLYYIFTTESVAENAYNMMVLSTVESTLPRVLCYLFVVAGAAFALRKSMLAFLYTFLSFAVCGYRSVQVYGICANMKRAAAGTALTQDMINRVLSAQWIPLVYMAVLTTAFTVLAAVWLSRCRKERKAASEVQS